MYFLGTNKASYFFGNTRMRMFFKQKVGWKGGGGGV